MTAVRTVPVENMRGEVAEPFWPADRRRLIVTLEAANDAVVIARGRDPDNNEAAFAATLQADQEAAFLQAVIDGVSGHPVSNDNDVPVNGTIVITGSGSGEGAGPRFWIALSQ